MADRDDNGRFQPGWKGGPGRPKGARSRLSEAFLRVLADDFEEHGIETLEKLREDQPAQYTRAIVALMPKLMELSGPDGDDIPLSGLVKFVKSDKS